MRLFLFQVIPGTFVDRGRKEVQTPPWAFLELILRAPGLILARWGDKRFGAAKTHSRAFGACPFKTYGLIEEDVTVVTSFTNEEGLIHLDAIRDFAAELSLEMGQEAIAIEIDNSMEFVASMALA